MRIIRSLFLLVLIAGGAWMSTEPAGAEVVVNTYTPDAQTFPVVASGAAGEFVVVWGSRGEDGSQYGVFGQRFDSAGNFAGSEFQVNGYTTYDQRHAAVAVAPGGDFVVVWDSYSQDGNSRGVFGRRYDSTGALQGTEFQVNSFTSSNQSFPSLAAASGQFVVVWESWGAQDGSGAGVFGQRYDHAGSAVGSEFQINTYTPDFQLRPAVCAADDGNFVVAWQSTYQDGHATGIFAQRFDSSGTGLGAEFQVNTYTPGNQGNGLFPVRARSSGICCAGNGDFVVVWHSSSNQDGYNYGIFGQRYASTGTPQGSEFQINTYTSSGQVAPEIACDHSGAFLVAWRSRGQDDGSNDGVFAQRYDSIGAPAGVEFQVNTYTPGAQGYYGIGVGALAGGDFAVVWADGDIFSNGQFSSVFVRRSLGAPPGPTPTATPVSTICPLLPANGCATPQKGAVNMVAPANSSARRLEWTWRMGTAALADFSDPVSSTHYGLCVYANEGLISSTEILPGAYWAAIGHRGFWYRHSAGNAAGIFRVAFYAGSGNARIKVRGKGEHLALPLPIAPSNAVRVQLIQNPAGPECWETSFAAPGLQSTATRFKDNF